MSVTFHFPASVRSACEQYLLHFGEFLRELGVSAAVRLQEFGEQVFFAVAPRDQRDALENIKAVLEVYLRFPNAELVGLPTADDDLIMYKLRANVSHLQAQLELARAQSAMLREHVEVQRVAIELLATSLGRLSSHQGKRSIQGRSGDEDLELLTQYVSVAPLAHGPLRIDLPQLLRDIKRLFRRDAGGA